MIEGKKGKEERKKTEKRKKSSNVGIEPVTS